MANGTDAQDNPAYELLYNLNCLHTTDMGAERIKRNLSLDTEDVVGWCRDRISGSDAVIRRQGKNWYVINGDCEITVNAHSYTIITAHRTGKRSQSGGTTTIAVRYVEEADRQFWYTMDGHLAETEFMNKVRDKRGYIALENDTPVGILRYNLFWDNIPFCTLLFIHHRFRKKGYGRRLMEFWEQDMRAAGHGMVLVSTQVDEDAQHFYRKIGYKDCGSLVMDIPGYEQPMEMFMAKNLAE